MCVRLLWVIFCPVKIGNSIPRNHLYGANLLGKIYIYFSLRETRMISCIVLNLSILLSEYPCSILIGRRAFAESWFVSHDSIWHTFFTDFLHSPGQFVYVFTDDLRSSVNLILLLVLFVVLSMESSSDGSEDCRPRYPGWSCVVWGRTTQSLAWQIQVHVVTVVLRQDVCFRCWGTVSPFLWDGKWSRI